MTKKRGKEKKKLKAFPLSQKYVNVEKENYEKNKNKVHYVTKNSRPRIAVMEAVVDSYSKLYSFTHANTVFLFTRVTDVFRFKIIYEMFEIIGRYNKVLTVNPM